MTATGLAGVKRGLDGFRGTSAAAVCLSIPGAGRGAWSLAMELPYSEAVYLTVQDVGDTS